jgi:hypothetical protein
LTLFFGHFSIVIGNPWFLAMALALGFWQWRWRLASGNGDERWH